MPFKLNNESNWQNQVEPSTVFFHSIGQLLYWIIYTDADWLSQNRDGGNEDEEEKDPICLMIFLMNYFALIIIPANWQLDRMCTALESYSYCHWFIAIIVSHWPGLV